MNETKMVETAVASAEAKPSKPVLLGKHHDITGFASDEPTRYIINSVHYNASVGCMEATDGSVLVRVPVSSVEVDEFPPTKAGDATLSDCVIPLGPYKKGLANIPKGITLPVLGCARLSTDAERVTLVTTDLETEQAVSARLLEGRYPDTDQAIPQAEAKLTIALGSRLLRKLADYAEKHGKEADGRGGVAITFAFVDELTPVRFSLPLAIDPTQRVTGVLCSMRKS